MNTSLQRLAAILESRVAAASSLRSSNFNDDLSDLPDALLHSHLTSLIAAIERVAGKSSVYSEQVVAVLKGTVNTGIQIKRLCGVGESLTRDVNDGMLTSTVELIHAELFADFLEMAQHLVDSGYKDPGAVVCGSALESHLRQLATKHNITSVDANQKPKKADLLNAELSGAAAYSKLDQKSVTAWLDLRNKAAHGHYTEYQQEQVALMISGVRDFIGRCPA